MSAALSRLIPLSPADSPRYDLDISLNQSVLVLEGTGLPTGLSGHVALSLSQPTDIKEVTLRLEGKIRLPTDLSNISSLRSCQTYVLCDHQWSFLEGSKKSNHTMKPGRHIFPFRIQIGGSLPSTLPIAGVSVVYKLHAHAVRSGLHRSLQTSTPITLLRTFSTEALEHQTVEVEDTWPGKLMYSFSISHTTWAAGDNVVSLVKFSPLTKGVRVSTIHTSLIQTTKIAGSNSSGQAIDHIVASSVHKIVRGKVVEMVKAVEPCAGFSSPTASSNSMTPQNGNRPTEDAGDGTTSSDVVSRLSLHIPSAVVASRGYEPILISYRIQWVIFLANTDGHMSELRCVAPVHILDHYFLDEVRRLNPPFPGVSLSGEEMERTQNAEADSQDLPAYHAHPWDAVPNILSSGALERGWQIQATPTLSIALAQHNSIPEPVLTLVPSSNPTYIHKGQDASRPGGIHEATLDPGTSTSLVLSSWIQQSSSQLVSPQDRRQRTLTYDDGFQLPLARGANNHAEVTADPADNAHLTQVPSYEHAVLLGQYTGVVPLTSMEGLPSYAE